MFPHWNYVLENLFGRVRAVTARAVTHIPERWDEQGRTLRPRPPTTRPTRSSSWRATSIAQVNSSWAVRVDRGELVEFQVDGTHGSAVAGLFGCRVQPRVETPMPVWNPDLPDDRGLPRPVAPGAGPVRVRQRLPGAVGAVPAPTWTPAGRTAYDLAAGVRGLQLAEAGLRVLRRGSPGADRGVRVVRRGHASRLPAADGGWRDDRAAEPRAWAEHPTGFRTRIAFAAAHVVADPRAENVPGAPAALDWDATLAFRSHLFRHGLGVAEAMDTAQRNMGLDWATTQQLITRSSALARGARRPDRLRRRDRPAAGTGRRPGRGRPGLPRAGGVRRERRLRR